MESSGHDSELGPDLTSADELGKEAIVLLFTTNPAGDDGWVNPKDVCEMDDSHWRWVKGERYWSPRRQEGLAPRPPTRRLGFPGVFAVVGHGRQ